MDSPCPFHSNKIKHDNNRFQAPSMTLLARQGGRRLLDVRKMSR